MDRDGGTGAQGGAGGHRSLQEGGGWGREAGGISRDSGREKYVRMAREENSSKTVKLSDAGTRGGEEEIYRGPADGGVRRGDRGGGPHD